MRLITLIILITFMAIFFWSWLKETFRKAKIVRSQRGIVHRASSTFIKVCDSKTYEIGRYQRLLGVSITNNRIWSYIWVINHPEAVLGGRGHLS